MSDWDRGIRSGAVASLTAAFGVVAGLAWNDAVRSLLDYLLPLDRSTVAAKFAYALVVTAIAVIAARSLLRMVDRNEKQG